MEQQQINKQFQRQQNDNKQELGIDWYEQNQYTQLNALKRQRQLRKYMNVGFTPYNEYFNNKCSQLRLYESKANYYFQSNLFDRQRLGLQRQMMYYRGAVDQYFSEQKMRQYLQQGNTQKGFVHKKRNTSVIIEKTLFYSCKQIIYAVQIPLLNKQNVLQVCQLNSNPQLIVRFQKGDIILQIEEFKKQTTFYSQNQIHLMVRLPRKVVVVNALQKTFIHTILSDIQFLQAKSSLYDPNILQTTQFDGKISTFKCFETNSQHNQQRTNQLFKTNDLVVQSFDLNKNQIFLTKYKSLSILDKRMKKEIMLHSINSMKNDIFLNSIPLKGYYSFSPYISTCQMRHITIFDLRKTQQFHKILHQCQQSPPQILTFYDGAYQQKLDSPILICHSPHVLGSSIAISMNSYALQINKTSEQSYPNSNNFTTSNFFLLQDEGKKSSNRIQQTINSSISCFSYKNNQVGIFQIDNTGNIDLQILKFQQEKEKYVKYYYQIRENQQSQFEKANKQMKEKQQRLCNFNVWLKNNFKQKYFREQNQYKNVQKKKQFDKQEKGKRKIKNLKIKSRQASKQKNSKYGKQKIKQDLTQSDDLNLQNTEYQNLSECEKTFEKRKMNYLNLTKLNLTLKSRAEKQINSLKIAQSEEKYKNISKTQPNTQDFSLQQKQSKNKFTNIFAFHQKKMLNFPICQMLRNQWDT